MADVVTRGTGEYEAVADQTDVSVSFAADAASRSQAMNALAQKMAAVDPVLHRDGVTVRQRNVHVGDRWEGRRRVGVTAMQQLTLRIVDLEALDEVLAALFTAEPRWFDGPHWSLANETSATREAQRLAVADARARARAYADALGVRLGTLIRISDEGAERPYPMMRAAMSMSAESAGVGRDAVQQLGLTPEQVTIRVSCTGTWALLD